MAETALLIAEVRSETGSRNARKLRARGRIPAVLYGHKLDSIPLTVNGEEVQALLRHGAHGLIELNVAGAKESAIIKAMQWDVFGEEVLHVDFTRVSADETLVIDAPITLKGTAPGTKDGGILDHRLHSVQIECPATNIQESVVVNINSLKLEEAIYVRDLEFAEGISPKADPDQIVVQVRPPAEEAEEEEGVVESAEPELIRREDQEEGQPEE